MMGAVVANLLACKTAGRVFESSLKKKKIGGGGGILHYSTHFF